MRLKVNMHCFPERELILLCDNRWVTFPAPRENRESGLRQRGGRRLAAAPAP